jgi:hypothetical protein
MEKFPDRMFFAATFRRMETKQFQQSIAGWSPHFNSVYLNIFSIQHNVQKIAVLFGFRKNLKPEYMLIKCTAGLPVPDDKPDMPETGVCRSGALQYHRTRPVALP